MTSITLSHAVRDENGRGMYGKAGDQDGLEVRLQKWYISGNKWDFVLRCKNKALAQLIADNAIAGARNDLLGYDMNQRYTAYDYLKSKGFDLTKLDIPCECDCSQLATMCANYAGIQIPRDTYTANMKSRYSATNCFKILESNKYTTMQDNLRVGDILVRAGHHTAIVVNSLYWLQSSIKKGCKGRTNDVKAIQTRLNELMDASLIVDGDFGNRTDSAVKSYQRVNQLEVDGIVGKSTAEKMGFIYG